SLRARSDHVSPKAWGAKRRTGIWRSRNGDRLQKPAGASNPGALTPARALTASQIELVAGYWQLAQPSTRCCEDRIGQCRRDRRGARFTNAPGRLVAIEEVHLDCWNFADSQQTIIMKIALLDTSSLDCDFAE